MQHTYTAKSQQNRRERRRNVVMVNNTHKYAENLTNKPCVCGVHFFVFKLKTGDVPNNLQVETNHNNECNVENRI